MIDIDFFKNVNDTKGHDVGDYVLQELVRLLQRSIRHTDRLVRWGGEEFVILIQIDGRIGLQRAMQHICQVIEAHTFEHIGHMTCSIGTTLYDAGETIEQTLKRADEALYKAKANGRNQVVYN